MRPYNWAVFIGRFSPFHVGHLETLQHGLNIADRVLFLLGSSYQSLNTRNPITYEDRVDIIRASLSDEDRKRVSFTALVDFPYSESRWNAEVQRLVWEVTQNNRVVLIGVEKDATSYYLNEFPMWEYSPCEIVKSVSSTDIREAMFQGNYDDVIPYMCTDEAYNLLTNNWRLEADSMWHYEQEYKKKYGLGPFLTVDAAVVQSGHMLLVTRKHYGKGQLALPGGFVEKDETVVDAMLRELREETGLRIPKKILRGSIKKNQLFDAPNRSNRARIITYAYAIELNHTEPLPRVSGGDDAEQAEWIPLSAIIPNRMFEDHYHIIAQLHGLSMK